MTKGRDERIELGGGELKHSPFASLRARFGGADAPGAATPPAAATAPPSGVDAPVSARGARFEVRHERKGRGGKTVTVARPLGGGPAPDLDGFARLLGPALGTAARVEDGAVVLQGDLVERLLKVLERDHGITVVRGTAR